MNQERELLDKLKRMMTESLKAYQEGFASLVTEMLALGSEGEDPQAALQELMQNWSATVKSLSEMPNRFMERLGQERPEDLAGRVKPKDGERMNRLFESLVQEYLDDFAGMRDDAFRVDIKPLLSAWGKTLKGESDRDADKIMRRFADALGVKARHGSEYYADPDKTPVGQTPRECVFRQGKIELYRYTPLPDVALAKAPPVLLVYSLINRSYILDLMPGSSFIEYLLEQGLDVYLIEWGECEPGDRETTLDSLIEPGISGCVDAICARTGADKVSMLGHCIGGNLGLMYAALHPDKVARFVALTTPVTSSEGGVVALWTDRDVMPIDQIIDSSGHMPAKLIRYTFIALKPYYEAMKWKMFIENLGDDRMMELFYPVDRWANENVDIPGEVFRKFIREVFIDDGFSQGKTLIHGRPVELSRITCPLLNLAASKDWIVKLKSAQILNELVGSADKRFELIEDSHVGIMINPASRKHWDSIVDFFKAEDGARKIRKAYVTPALRSQPVDL